MNQIGIFSSANFNYTAREGSDTLDLNIAAQTDKPYDFTF